jgi:hypothetical protein
VQDIISYPQGPRCYIGFQPPRGHLSGPESHCNYPALSYKRTGWTPLHRGGKKERLRQGRLEYNTTQFSHGCRVLRLDGPNHVNHRVHRVHLGLTNQEAKGLPHKRITAGCSCSGSGGSVAKPLRHHLLQLRKSQH